MPAEMLASTCVSAPTSCPPSSASTATTGGSTGSAKGSNGGNGNSSRKERSCKGKRYLEMIGESKGGNGSSAGCKRPKSNSVSAGSHATGDPAGTESSSPTKSSSSAAGSHSHKWVSGGFDLEERIAALPQLQDTHLVNALNNNRRNTANGKAPGQNGSSDSVGGRSGHNSPTTHALVNGDAKQHYVNNNNNDEKMRASSEEKLVMATPSPASSTSTVCSGDEASDGDSRSSPVPAQCRPQPQLPPADQASPQSAITGASSGAAAGSGREFLSASNFTSLTRSQGLDVGPCDGLTALAEVALSQAQAITTSPSS